jgi:hypothetical protein
MKGHLLFILYDINRTSLKSLIDRVFARARLDLRSKASVEVRRCIREALNAHIEPFALGALGLAQLGVSKLIGTEDHNFTRPRTANTQSSLLGGPTDVGIFISPPAQDFGRSNQDRRSLPKEVVVLQP